MLQAQFGIHHLGRPILPEWGLGILPGGAAATSRVATGPAPAQVTTGEGGTAQNVCTKDRGLIYINGAWRVRSLDKTPCATVATETSLEVANGGQPIYVGPFRLDPKSSAGQIATLDTPAQIGSDWGAWLAQAYSSIGQALAKNGKAPKPYTSKTPIPSVLPRVVGATQDFIDDGTMHGRPFGDPFPAIQPDLASGGHALHPAVAWFDNDPHGYRITRVQYAGDDNVYSYYSAAQWLTALGAPFVTDGIGWLVDYRYLKPSNTIEFNRDGNLPPVARFTYPGINVNAAALALVGGVPWGMWLSIAPTSGEVRDASIDQALHWGGIATPTRLAEGDWDTSIDGPNGHIMQVALGPMPQEGVFDQIADALLWIPETLGAVLWDIASFVGTLTCDIIKAGSFVAQLPKDPGSQAAALAAVATASKACPGAPQTDCRDPKNAVLCVRTTPAQTPWYKRWYIIAPAIAVAALGVVSLVSSGPER